MKFRISIFQGFWLQISRGHYQNSYLWEQHFFPEHLQWLLPIIIHIVIVRFWYFRTSSAKNKLLTQLTFYLEVFLLYKNHPRIKIGKNAEKKTSVEECHFKWSCRSLTGQFLLHRCFFQYFTSLNYQNSFYVMGALPGKRLRNY